MPLILAIEPDRRQASRVTALARGTLGAELLVADSSEHGLTALGGRAPDLILTSRLLSPKDEAGLRAFDSAGVPVPTLMIPVLAAPARSQERSGGLLARMPWSKASSSPVDCDGCDPQVFASQIAEYLSEVQEAHQLRPVQPPPPVEGVPAVQAVEPAQELDLVQEFEPEPVQEFEPAQVFEPVQELEPVEEAPVEAAAVAAAPAPIVERAVVEAEIIDEPGVVIAEETVVEFSVASAEWEDVQLEEDDDAPIELSSEAIDLQAFVDELNATYADLFPRDVPPEPVVVALAPESLAAPAPIETEPPVMTVEPEPAPAAPVPYRPALAHALPTFAVWPRVEGPVIKETPAAQFTDAVAEFAAALDFAEEEPDTSCQGDADSDLWMPLSTAPGVVWPRLDSACSRTAPPAQDEWGFFDPDQCGFAALVAKLDQVAR